MTSKPRASISKTPAQTSPSSSVQSRLFTPVQHDLSPLDFDNEKSVQKQVEEIVAEFKAKDKEWTHRYKALLLLQRVINGNAVEMKSWLTMLRYMTLPLLDQLTEVRATIAKEACQVVTLLAQRMKTRFEPYALQYLGTLIKLVVVKVTVTAEAAHQTVKEILSNIATKSLLQTFLDSSMDQHNESLRKRCAEYILIIMNRAIQEDNMILASSVGALEKSIEKLLVDSGSEIRHQARFCFWAYAELNEKSAIQMFYQFTTTTQRNLFSIEEKLNEAQKEVADKIRQAIIEEEENQKLVEQSADLDLDMNDFRGGNVNTSSNSSSLDTNRAKTPNSGRASGLKTRVPVNLGSLSSNNASSSSNIIKRSGSSLGMKSSITGSPSGSFEERSIKKPAVDPLMRSKSSLGTSRRVSEAGTSASGSGSSLSIGSKSKTTTSSPNSNMSGRYSSIGTRGTPGTGISSPLSATLTKQSSSSNLTRSLPPQSGAKSGSSLNLSSTLTRSTPPPTLKQPATTSSASSTVARPPSASLMKKPASSTTLTSTMLKKPTTVAPVTKASPPPTLTKSKAATSSTTTTTTTTSTTTKPKTTATSSNAPTITKSVKKASTNEDTSNLIKSFKSRKDSIIKSSETSDDIDINSIEESLNYNKDAFHEISHELEGSLREAKNEISDLTLDDISVEEGSRSNRNSQVLSSKRKSFKIDDDFNWIEDSIDQDLIENDPLDFNDLSNDDNIDDLTLNELNIQPNEGEEEEYVEQEETIIEQDPNNVIESINDDEYDDEMY